MWSMGDTDPSRVSPMQHAFAPYRLPALLLPIVLLAACGGGGGGGSTPPAPAVTAPAGGAIWGGTRTITWTGTAAATNVQVLLSDDGGATFGTVLAASTANDGSFDLDTTGFSDDVDYRVRVVLPSAAELTSGDFAIDNTAPVATLTSPVGTEILGNTPTVTWTTTDAHPGTVEIRLSSDDGANYDTVVVAATADDGSYEWSTTALADGTQYRLQIVPTDLAANEGSPSVSLQSFEIDRTPPVIVLTAPNGGESWSGAQTITWNTTETNLGTVALALSTDSGATFPTVIAAAATDNGSYSWATGEAPDGTTLRVRAIATDLAGNASTADVSDADFSVENLRINGPAHYLDVNQNGSIDAGDQLYLRFDKQVTVNGAAAGDFSLGVTGDSFGTGAGVAAGPELDSVVVTLGTNPTLRTRGLFDSGSTSGGRPSGMDISASIAADAIEATGSGLDAAPSGTKDVRPSLVAVDTGVTSPGTPSCVAAVDVAHDGNMDFVIGDSAGGGITVVTYGGGFSSTTGLAVTALDLVLGDVDGDGDADMVVANGAGVQISLGVGGTGFAAFGTEFGVGNARSVALADFDSDGDLDLFVGHTSGGADRVLLNDGAGAFTDTTQVLGSGNTESLAVGDLDGDGDLDVVAASNAGSQPVRAWMNDGAAVFTAGDAITVTQAQDVALGTSTAMATSTSRSPFWGRTSSTSTTAPAASGRHTSSSGTTTTAASRSSTSTATVTSTSRP
jgi:hypothetical protein